MQRKYLEMAEKGELICDESVPPSPAVTPRQSMADTQDSTRTGDESPSAALPTLSSSSAGEQAKEDEKGSSFVNILLL